MNEEKIKLEQLKEGYFLCKEQIAEQLESVQKSDTKATVLVSLLAVFIVLLSTYLDWLLKKENGFSTSILFPFCLFISSFILFLFTTNMLFALSSIRLVSLTIVNTNDKNFLPSLKTVDSDGLSVFYEDYILLLKDLIKKNGYSLERKSNKLSSSITMAQIAVFLTIVLFILTFFLVISSQ